MTHEIQSFEPVNADHWTRIKAKLLAEAGLTITDDKGEAGAHGVKISYEYAAPTLTIQLLDKPFFLSAADINQRIHVFVEHTA